MKLSILDQSPVPEGSTPAEALRQTALLAREAERLGLSPLLGRGASCCSGPRQLQP